jgi:hypothetical protein
MNLKHKQLFLLFAILLVLIPLQSALADTGPKPSMEFQFTQKMAGEALTITSGILFECDLPDCSDGEPIEELGPQGFRCDATSCSAIAYGFAPYHQLELEFSDGQTRQSNVFETAGFDSRYRVTIRPADLLVQTQFRLGGFPSIGTVIVACLCALLSIALVAGLAVFLITRSKTA